MAYCPEAKLHRALIDAAGPELARAAEQRVPVAQSCRNWNRRRALRNAGACLLLLGALAYLFPVATFALLCGWTALTLFLLSLLKAASAIMALRALAQDRAVAGAVPAEPVPARLPVVSILVPLYREREIAAKLLSRLAALDYPRHLLDVCLVLEDEDTTTHLALGAARLKPGILPQWLQVIEVPQGTLRTKPRALNYALSFAKGTIIGIYDAEDAPAPDQIRKVVQRFAQRGRDVACLQGALDFYNSDCNWLARCFTIEYATWFRIVLPGLLRLGLVIPLGGTTLFLRRNVIETLGGWDAHNVTEDADLGLRLARHGYRTEIIESVTQEEANARLWPWVRQRSRWIKGYALTWAVHTSDPRQLWRDLGPWRFFGVQVLFLGTISQFVLAPLMWSFWPMIIGMPHPLADALPRTAVLALILLFLLAEAISIAVAVVATRQAGKRRLGYWAPTLPLYFPLATFAAYKGLAEIVTRPFFWDKTAHGIFKPSTALTGPPQLHVVDAPRKAPAPQAQATPLPRPLRRPA